MENLDISAEMRQKGNGGAAGRLRAESIVPAVLYGHKVKENLVLSVKMVDAEKALGKSQGGNALINLKIEGNDDRVVMFKDIQRHPSKETLQHIDFLEVVMDEKVIVDIPVHLTGKCEGVTLGGILEQPARTIKVECLPANIPASIDVDVTSLLVGGSVHVKEVTLPEGVEPMDAPDHTLVLVTQPREEKVEEVVEGEEGAEVAEGEEGAAPAEATEDKKEG